MITGRTETQRTVTESFRTVQTINLEDMELSSANHRSAELSIPIREHTELDRLRKANHDFLHRKTRLHDSVFCTACNRPAGWNAGQCPVPLSDHTLAGHIFTTEDVLD